VHVNLQILPAQHPRAKPKTKQAFTLVELSIVLVIIGLIVGGVVVGADLIRVAKLRSVTSETERIDSAVSTFSLKYSCLPGDCSFATNSFPVDSLGCPSGGDPKGTCNGDGNGQVGQLASFYGANANESFRFWQQLSFAGFYGGGGGSAFTGVAGALGSRDVQIGVNVPRSKVENAGYSIYFMIINGASDRWDTIGHYYYFGSKPDPWGAQYENGGATLTGVDAYWIDNKYDDGIPSSGAILSIYKSFGCPTTTSSSTAQYNKTSHALQCSLLIKAGF
jgi:prepilin-type N-terminal cleavage/methylation domain-containing protein